MDLASLLIAALSAAVAALAWREAAHSRKAAQSSATAADRSATVAETALVRSSARTDVAWRREPEPGRPGLIRVVHAGTTPAQNVQVTIAINGERALQDYDVLDGGDEILHDAGVEYARRQELANEQTHRNLESNFISIAQPVWAVEVRVTWFTPEGQPGVWVWNNEGETR